MKKRSMMMKKIAKVIVHFDDGTFEEVVSSEKSVMPLFPQAPQAPYAPVTLPWVSPFTVTSKNAGEFSNAPMILGGPSSSTYSWSMGYMDNVAGTADGSPITNKYTITSTGNGHVEVQG